ncbi:MAG: prolipoprotein diacylglyceryl transferase [Rhodobacteraceae bacterium]|nr:prolipoprotein diacylglyceryl transferase [Paracoccaceae bacterium]
MSTGIPFPDIGRELFAFDVFGLHLALRWYALGYIVGIVIGWWIIRRAIGAIALWRGESPPMNRAQLEDMVTWIVIGIIAGGRLGYVLFYQPGYYLSHPSEIPMVWTGGMSFHGGFLGVIAAVWLFSRRHGLATASIADLLAIATPPALFLVRIANFINAELWGRPTEMPWGVIFPGEAAQYCPGFASPCARHPSQLYEALLEGIFLGAILLHLAWRSGWLKRPGALTGVFFLGYGLARLAIEFFRQADAQFISPDNPWGHVIRLGDLGITQGQLLSLPMVVIGTIVLIWARRRT